MKKTNFLLSFFTLLCASSLIHAVEAPKEIPSRLQQIKAKISYWAGIEDWKRFSKKVAIAFGSHYTKSSLMNLLDQAEPRHTFYPGAFSHIDSLGREIIPMPMQGLVHSTLFLDTAIFADIFMGDLPVDKETEQPLVFQNKENNKAQLIGWALACLTPKPRYIKHKIDIYRRHQAQRVEQERIAALEAQHQAMIQEAINTNRAPAILERQVAPQVGIPEEIARLVNAFLGHTAIHECGICTGPEVENNLTQTPCGHRFHPGCLLRWFNTRFNQGLNSNCPHCRNDNLRGFERQLRRDNR